MTLPTDLGVTTHFEVIRRVLGPVAGRKLLDIGCGASTVPRELAALGASCTGIDPFISARDWESVGDGRWRILAASAEALPIADASIDAVLFIFSLHHVPAASLAAAFREARRVLAPGGSLYVAEPLAEGDFNDLLSTFHDEREVRAEAQRALGPASRLFSAHTSTHFTERRRFDDFSRFADMMCANTRFNSYREEDVVAPAVEARFASIAARTGGIFDQPVKIDLFG